MARAISSRHPPSYKKCCPSRCRAMPTVHPFADFRCLLICAKLDASLATACLNRLFVKPVCVSVQELRLKL